MIDNSADLTEFNRILHYIQPDFPLISFLAMKLIVANDGVRVGLYPIERK
jgi:hypothetical protein